MLKDKIEIKKKLKEGKKQYFSEYYFMRRCTIKSPHLLVFFFNRICMIL